MRSPDDKTKRKNHRLIFLVGFMGAGKTTIGRKLAKVLKFKFIDLDKVIEKRAGATVREIFAKEGEPEFRRMEREALSQCVNLKDYVVALGGGAFVTAENREMISREGITVWLDCSLDVCLRRVASDRSRPLLADRSEMESLLQKRVSSYSLADYRIDCGERFPADIALEIAFKINSERSRS